MAVPFERLVAEDLNIGRSLVDVTMPAGGTAQGHQIDYSTFFEFNVKLWYGAKGDGATDDLGAVLRALSDATRYINADPANVAVIYFPGGKYRLSGPINALGASRIHWKGEGKGISTLLWDDTADAGLTIDTVTNAAITSAITADVVVGAYDLAITGDATVFPRDGWAYIQDNLGTHGTFLSRIYNTSGSTVTLAEASPVTLAAASGATLFCYNQYPLLEGVVIRDLTFACVAGKNVVHKLTLLFLSRINKVRVIDCDFDGSTGPLITTRALKNGVIERCDFINAETVAGAGIEAQTSTGLTIAFCSTYHTRFGFTLARSPRGKVIGCNATSFGDPTFFGRMMKFSGGSNFSVCIGNTNSDAGFTGIRVENSAYVAVTGNTWLSNSQDQTGAGTIELAADATLTHHCCITGNVIHGGLKPAGFLGNAGLVEAYDVAGLETWNTWVGNTVTQCGSYACYLTGKHATVTGNTFGSYLTGGAILYVAGGGYNTIDSNTFETEGGATLSPAIYTLGNGHNLIGQNKATAGYTLDPTDTVMASSIWKRSLYTSNAVHTGANLTETTAWNQLITGLTFSVNGDSIDLVAHFSTGATATDKIIRLYIGAAGAVVFTLPAANDGNGSNCTLRYHGVFDTGGGGFVYATATLNGRSAAGTWGYDYGAGSGATDWTVDQHIKITIQNAVANANDVNFDFGRIVFNSINITPTPVS